MGFNTRKKKKRVRTTKSELTKEKAGGFQEDDSEILQEVKKKNIKPQKIAKSKYKTDLTMIPIHSPESKGTKTLRGKKDIKTLVKEKEEKRFEGEENPALQKVKDKSKSKHETIFTMRQASKPQKKGKVTKIKKSK